MFGWECGVVRCTRFVLFAIADFARSGLHAPLTAGTMYNSCDLIPAQRKSRLTAQSHSEDAWEQGEYGGRGDQDLSHRNTKGI